MLYFCTCTINPHRIRLFEIYLIHKTTKVQCLKCQKLKRYKSGASKVHTYQKQALETYHFTIKTQCRLYAPIYPAYLKCTHFAKQENRRFVKYRFCGAFSVHSFLKRDKIALPFNHSRTTNPHKIRILKNPFNEISLEQK